MLEGLFTYDPLQEYRLILDPPAFVKKKVADVKTAFDSEYKGGAIAGGQAFVYLATFWQNESMEQPMMDALHKVSLGAMPFKTHLKGFSQKDQREIFIKIEPVKPIELLIDHLKTIRSFFKNEIFNELPRISVARKLHPFQFQKSWKQFEHARFSATFIVQGMMLLKRMEGYRSWQIARRFEFENMIVTS